ncbi:type II secretion system F family protein [Paenibacillus cymbidii]|uniref:type II secretion system F family protein n=1 Tax=Paenibacillus cymbidii TaxID=1639034 RepID=UPI00107FF97F|nr:type II secretion system F family protein [Paenibacillus cymbidii]
MNAGYVASLWSNRLLPIAASLAEQAGLQRRFPQLAAKIHVKAAALYGSAQAHERTKQVFASALAAEIGMLAFGSALGALSGDWMTPVMAAGVLTVVIPVAAVKRLDRLIARKRRSMLLELPEFLNKLTLLVGAGDTVQAAIGRCVAKRIRESGVGAGADAPGQAVRLTPLYRELGAIVQALDNRQSLAQALEEMCKRCGMAEVSTFATTVLLNYRRGGNDFVYALGELSRAMWEKRKAMSRTLGEEASAKLVVPMVIIFIVVMIVVAAPAVLMMNRM